MAGSSSSSSPPLRLRIVLLGPPAGVRWALQEGRDRLLPPVLVTPDAVVLEATVVLGPVAAPDDGSRPLRGPAVQGPKGARFVYAASGSYAGAAGATSGRRAKVPLPDPLPAALAAAWAAEPTQVLEARIAGTARDGGPAAATVSLLDGGWRLVPPAGA